MSDLTAAMQAAVDSVDGDRRRRTGSGPHTALHPAGGVHLREEHSLPPVVGHRHEPTTFTETLRAQYGPLVATAWTALREAVLMVVLFWVSAILLAFVEVEGAVHVPGIGDATVVTVAVASAAVLRAVLAAASRSGQALESRATQPVSRRRPG